MVPNVYCMSQYSTGPLITKRPYFSSANYIDQMSNFHQQPNIYKKIIIKLSDSSIYELEWYELWNILFYNFIYKNKKEFSYNYSTAMFVNMWKKKTSKEKKLIVKLAKNYIY